MVCGSDQKLIFSVFYLFLQRPKCFLMPATVRWISSHSSLFCSSAVTLVMRNCFLFSSPTAPKPSIKNYMFRLASARTAQKRSKFNKLIIFKFLQLCTNDFQFSNCSAVSQALPASQLR